jgi:hypothetical protein
MAMSKEESKATVKKVGIFEGKQGQATTGLLALAR